MRITKKLLRDARTRLDQSVRDMFKLDDVRLAAFVKSMFPNLVTSDEAREELLKVGTLLLIEKSIPDHYVV